MISHSLEPLQEGVHDPYIFKAIFMAGAPGSGKSTVRQQLFGGTGLKLVDADEVRRAYVQRGEPEDYAKYGTLVRKQSRNYASQRLGIIMDRTAWRLSSVVDTTHQLRSLGYDVGMIHVHVSLPESLIRVQQRAELTGRHVPEHEVRARYEGLQEHIRDYVHMFQDAFWFVDNSGAQPRLDLVKRDILRWLREPPQSAQARTWIQSHARSLKEVNHMTKPKRISAGVIITDGVHILLGHVTGDVNWDIPKGGIDPGETAMQAAVRELREETSLGVNPSDLQYLGPCSYSATKDLELFLWRVPHMPDAHELHCASQFTDSHTGEQIPELDDFAVVPYDHALDMVNHNLRKVLVNHAHVFQG